MGCGATGGAVASGEAGFGGLLDMCGFRQGVGAAVCACTGRGQPGPAAGVGVARLGRGGGGLSPPDLASVSVNPSPMLYCLRVGMWTA